MFFRSFCTHFVLFLLLKHILLRSISLFRLLFKSLFSFCLKKMVRSIIVKGGVSRERVVVKDSNDFSRLSGHWSRSVILTLTTTNSLRIFSILSKYWDTLVPSCILLGKNRCRRNFMFTIVTDSYILCGVSPISHADSMSPTETSILSLTTISTASKNFFTVYNYGCCSYAFFCCLATTTSTWLKKPLAPDLRASLFSRMKKKRSCSLRSNCILIFQTSTFRGSILRCLTIVCVNAVIISATIDPEDCIATISAQPGLSYQKITIFSWKKENLSRNVQSWDLLLLSGSKWERHIVWFDSKNYIYIIRKSSFKYENRKLFEITPLSLDNGFLRRVCILLSSQNPTSEKQQAFPSFVCALWLSPFKRPNGSPKGRV